MKFYQAVLVLLLTLACSSCDPFHSLIVSNDSKYDKKIQVIFPDETFSYLELPDSLLFQVKNKISGSKSMAVRRAISKDTLGKSYFFILPSEQTAILEMGFGMGPILNQRIIIEDVDTVVVNKKSKRIIKRPKIGFGGEYNFTIKDLLN